MKGVDRTTSGPAAPPGSDGASAIQPFPLESLLSLRLEEPANGAARGGFEVAPVHLNPNGVVHGGSLFALVDTLMGLACMSVLPVGNECSTVDLHVRYFRPVTAGVVDARVWVIHQGRRFISLVGEVQSDGGMVASATGTLNNASG